MREFVEEFLHTMGADDAFSRTMVCVGVITTIVFAVMMIGG